MAKIKDVLEIESHRESIEQCRVINLFQEGTFYRAYEWSAWLCVRYIQQFKATNLSLHRASSSLLLEIAPKIKVFLSVQLSLSFHDGKMKITSVWHGVEFLGAWLKPHRIYTSREAVVRIRAKMRLLAKSGNVEKWHSSLNSYCGVLSHWNNYKLRKKLLTENPVFGKYGMFTMDYKKYNAVSFSINW